MRARRVGPTDTGSPAGGIGCCENPSAEIRVRANGEKRKAVAAAGVSAPAGSAPDQRRFNTDRVRYDTKPSGKGRSAGSSTRVEPNKPRRRTTTESGAPDPFSGIRKQLGNTGLSGGAKSGSGQGIRCRRAAWSRSGRGSGRYTRAGAVVARGGALPGGGRSRCAATRPPCGDRCPPFPSRPVGHKPAPTPGRRARTRVRRLPRGRSGINLRPGRGGSTWPEASWCGVDHVARWVLRSRRARLRCRRERRSSMASGSREMITTTATSGRR